jgi:molecular chaperone GrpE
LNKDLKEQEQMKLTKCKDCLELQNKLEILAQQNKTLEQKLQDLEQHKLYMQADFDNYKKHIDKQLELSIELSNEKLLKELLNIVDDFERSLSTIKDKDDLNGITLVYNNLMKLLNLNNVKRIDCLGKQFDVKYCEVLLQEESNEKEGTVLQELQKGYIYKNKILRYAKVKVSQNNIEENKKDIEKE